MPEGGRQPVMVPVSQIEPIIRAVGLESEGQLLEIMSYLLIFISGAVFLIMFVLKAPYGRYSNTNVFGWGINSKVAWFIQELPSFLVPLFIMYMQPSPMVNRVLLSMYILHYFQRTFIFSLAIQGGKATPFLPFILAMIFCVYNGYLQGGYLINSGVYPDDWFRDPRFVLGSCLFFVGMFINIHSDSILRNLRKPGETGYKIPQGGMFEYVSGANFFGEIVEWTGFAIACWSLPGLSFALFTTSVVGHRAFHHHKWYLEKFEDYPTNRKAIIPFLV